MAAPQIILIVFMVKTGKGWCFRTVTGAQGVWSPFTGVGGPIKQCRCNVLTRSMFGWSGSLHSTCPDWGSSTEQCRVSSVACSPALDNIATHTHTHTHTETLSEIHTLVTAHRHVTGMKSSTSAESESNNGIQLHSPGDRRASSHVGYRKILRLLTNMST